MVTLGLAAAQQGLRKLRGKFAAPARLWRGCGFFEFSFVATEGEVGRWRCNRVRATREKDADAVKSTRDFLTQASPHFPSTHEMRTALCKRQPYHQLADGNLGSLCWPQQYRSFVL